MSQEEIKIFISRGIPSSWVFDQEYTGVMLTKNPKEADIIIKQADFEVPEDPCFNKKTREIYVLNYLPGRKRDGESMRNSPLFVDDAIKIKKRPINFAFSGNDFSHPYVINAPVNFNPPRMLQLPEKYWQKDTKFTNNIYRGKVFAKFSRSSHRIRKELFDFYEEIKNPRFEIENIKENMYCLSRKGTPPSAQFYRNYVKNLNRADMTFIPRGDRPSTHSFFDAISVGCIPVCINAMDCGWENIMNNVEDYMLLFDASKQSFEEMHAKIINTLENKNQILKMKRNCFNLYKTFFQKRVSWAWSEFMLAKCIEIYKNDFDLQKISSKLISEEVLKLKGIKNKI